MSWCHGGWLRGGDSHEGLVAHSDTIMSFLRVAALRSNSVCMDILLVTMRAVLLTGNGPRPTQSILSFCVQKADRTSEHSHCHCPCTLALTASRRELKHTPTRRIDVHHVLVSSVLYCVDG